MRLENRKYISHVINTARTDDKCQHSNNKKEDKYINNEKKKR